MFRFAAAGFLSGLLFLVLGGCATRPVGYSDFDADTDFSRYRSFSWISEHPLFVASPDPVNPALEGVLMDEIRTYLTAQGYNFTPRAEDADFVIALVAGGRSGVQTSVYPGRYQQAEQIAGRNWGGQVGTQDYNTGGIVIDIFDRPSAQKKWMGWTQTEITQSDRMNLRPVVRELVRTILAHFPPSD